MKKTLLLLTIGLLAGNIIGCITARRINNVHLGMSEPDVIKVLGKPVSRAENKDGSVKLFYSLVEGAGAVAPYSVTMVNGKVDAYGRDGASTQVPVIVPAPVMVPH